MNAWTTRLIAAALGAWLVGCASPPTSVLLHVDESPRSAITQLWAQISTGSGSAGAQQQVSGSIQLPGTLVIWLADSATPLRFAEAAPLQAKPRKDAVGPAPSPAALLGRIPCGATSNAATAGALGGAVLAVVDLAVEVPLLRDTTAAFKAGTSSPTNPGMASE